MNFFKIFRFIASLIAAAFIIYVISGPVSILSKVAYINFIAFITTQLYLYNKKRYRFLIIFWFVISVGLFAINMLAETGRI